MPESKNDSDHDLPSRVSKLETIVNTIHEDFGELKKDIRKIGDGLSEGGRTNWTLVFAGLAILGALYSAAVRPLVSDIERQTKDGEKLAAAVLLQNNKTSDLELQSIRGTTERASLTRDINSLLANGSPSIDKRLSILENTVEGMHQSIATMNATGSPAADRRLTLIEYRLNSVDPENKNAAAAAAQHVK